MGTALERAFLAVTVFSLIGQAPGEARLHLIPPSIYIAAGGFPCGKIVEGKNEIVGRGCMLGSVVRLCCR